MFKIEKGYDSVSKTFRLPTELVDTLEQLAVDNKLSLNKLVIQCLVYAVNSLDESDQNSMSLEADSEKEEDA